MKQYIVKFIYSVINGNIIKQQKTVTAENEVEAIEQVQDEITENLLNCGYEVENTGATVGVFTKNYDLISTYDNFEAMEVVNND